MSNDIRLLINELDQADFDKQVNYVEVPLVDGSYGIEAGHAPLVGVVIEGIVKYKIDNEEFYATVSDGVVSVMDNQVTIIVRSAEMFEEIDIDRAIMAEERARKMLLAKDSTVEHGRMEAALRRSLQRQKLYNMMHH